MVCAGRGDGEPVTISSEILYPILCLENFEEDGILLRALPNPEVERVVAKGVCRSDNRLHRLGETALTGDVLEKLPRKCSEAFL